jgi:hypothetical protein
VQVLVSIATDLNFKMNSRQWTLLNFDVKESRIESVCDVTNSNSSTSSLQSDLQDVQIRGLLPAQKKNKKQTKSVALSPRANYTD